MIRILKKGLHTSIQDLGRIGYRKYGVPTSGAMDMQSAKLSNYILGNKEKDAVMEVTLQGPGIEFLTATRIAICGADLSPSLNGTPTPLNKSILVQKGDLLDFGVRKTGIRSYLAIAGGFQTDIILGSRSFYEGITKSAVCDDGDEIAFHSSFGVGKFQHRLHHPQPINLGLIDLDVHKGPEFEMLNEAQKVLLFNTSFSLGINNRMAYQLQELLMNELPSILSSAVLPGSVQLTPAGKMIILMRDCQTTGGYPRILQLSENAINVLAQKMKNEKVSFELV